MAVLVLVWELAISRAAEDSILIIFVKKSFVVRQSRATNDFLVQVFRQHLGAKNDTGTYS